MSKMDWSFLGRLLEEGQKYSTGVGRVWLTVLFLLRILVLCTATEVVWDDEQEEFICNTLQPGCNQVCYDKAFPISHLRFFILQFIFVTTPTIFYFGYVALYVTREKKKEEKERQRMKAEGGDPEVSKKGKGEGKKEKAECGLEFEGGKAAPEVPKLKGRLLRFYMASIILKVLVEVGFATVQWFLYGFIIPKQYVCERSPCPHLVDCFISRPTEKTILIIYMYFMTAVSVLLNVVEFISLVCRTAAHWMKKKYLYQAPDTVQVVSPPSVFSTPESSAPVYSGQHFLHLPMGKGTTHPELESRTDWNREPVPQSNSLAASHRAARGVMARPENRSGSTTSSHSSSRTKKMQHVREKARGSQDGPSRHPDLDRDRTQKKRAGHQDHGPRFGKMREAAPSRLSL
ncbi:gap junction alpha-6 protein-like [Megalops cyprinoides]|uniref:gap junction alpha-6 protein-like n=1 Tax=Megalops cyprinoides TaxID=118141 RepID=UPI0018655EA4|nr:gap junction alpha-6 protein-like [Megalops cyprinoides]